MLDHLGKQLPRFLFRAVALGPEQPQPDFAYDSARRQYYADAILATLRALPLQEGERGLAVFSADIYTVRLNFLFGLADPEAGLGIISLHRLRPGFGRQANGELLKARALKEAIHELGHTYGLDHCPKAGCVMHFSNSLHDTDLKGPGFCDECAGRLPHPPGPGVPS